MATVTETSSPRRVEISLFVVTDFRDSSGTDWRAGDRAPLARLAVREAARTQPELFVVEHETLPFDPQADWFEAVTETYEARYAEAKRHRDGAEERRQQALRDELKEQEAGQPELERRFKQQEKEQEQRRKKARDKRKAIENELESGHALRSGFHYND